VQASELVSLPVSQLANLSQLPPNLSFIRILCRLELLVDLIELVSGAIIQLLTALAKLLVSILVQLATMSMPEDRFKIVFTESVIYCSTQLKWCLDQTSDCEEYLF